MEGSTETTYDDQGRVRYVETFDRNHVSTGVVSTEYNVAPYGSSLVLPTVQVTDQSDKRRLTAMDGLGRLVWVREDPTRSANDGRLNYLTSYQYDGRSNLTTVTQGSQTRTFAYDEHARLTVTFR
jgi:YD repeat-containing protein